jgi:hypothetical protein
MYRHRFDAGGTPVKCDGQLVIKSDADGAFVECDACRGGYRFHVDHDSTPGPDFNYEGVPFPKHAPKRRRAS